ncbi:hypothetical protein [Brevibacterium sediminis]|uniref:Uncharacterized protein n=1 Tax=Brevibacterium sediminis TaxID=1857024 RepID=A0A5C4X259_9MICO|nr:hypothetical protein [Brevibacterium sediminis]TNM55254.1 hypothetical protein FHQ09_08545 [Brevibacterium sediminis]
MMQDALKSTQWENGDPMPMVGTVGMMSAVSMAIYACIMLLVLAVLIVGLMVLLKLNRRLGEDNLERAKAKKAAEDSATDSPV